MSAVICVDGPSGVGKGTLSLMLAEQLGWHFLDSGALYRISALAALRHGIAFDDEAALGELALNLDVRFAPVPGAEPRVLLEGDDVTSEIRTEQAGNAASKVAAIPAVRAALLERQRAFAKQPGLVADGRDMGTTVFPGAPLKLFLTASAEVRGERRYKQLKDKGLDVNLTSLVAEIAERDERDASRSVSPLRPADDALVIDTSSLTIDAVFAKAIAAVEKAGLV